MPGYVHVVPATNSPYGMFQARVWDEDWDIRYDTRYSYRKRGSSFRAREYSYGWGHWPTMSGFVSDPSAQAALVFTQDFGNTPGQPYPWITGNQGSQNLKFIMGRCKDDVGNGVSGAIVQGFVTATELFVRETTANSDGYYELGTEYAGTDHYLVAYRSGSPDIAGTTVNTLRGTNRDNT